MVSTVLLPATLIIALFGTNLVGSVSALPVATPAGFGLMVACIALVTLAILAAFRRRGWL